MIERLPDVIETSVPESQINQDNAVGERAGRIAACLQWLRRQADNIGTVVAGTLAVIDEVTERGIQEDAREAEREIRRKETWAR